MKRMHSIKQPTHHGYADTITDTALWRRQGARLWHAAILDSSDDAIIAKTLEGRILDWNHGAQRIFGYTEQEILGKPITIIIPTELHAEENQVMHRVRAGERIDHYQTVRLSRSGGKIDVSLSLVPVRNREGKVIAISSIARDISQRKRSQEAVRESEERFRLVANTAPVMIWMSGPDKLCTYFNQRWTEFTGRPLEAELGNGWQKTVYPDDLKRCLDSYNKAFDRRETYKIEYRLRRCDGKYRWILASGVPRFNGDNCFAGYIGSAIDVTERKVAEEALSKVSQKLIEAHEDERTKIARELHDDVSQRLALLSVSLDHLKTTLHASAPDLTKDLEQIIKGVQDLSSDIHALSHQLHSSKLEYLGLTVAASSFCREIADRHKLEIGFHSGGILEDLPQEIALCLYRVLQEALQNGIKHSGSRHFDVDLTGTGSEIQLIVRDWGAGFDPTMALEGHGLGLTGMKERLKLVRGDLSIESQPHSGATIHARVPVR